MKIFIFVPIDPGANPARANDVPWVLEDFHTFSDSNCSWGRKKVKNKSSLNIDIIWSEHRQFSLNIDTFYVRTLSIGNSNW